MAVDLKALSVDELKSVCTALALMAKSVERMRAKYPVGSPLYSAYDEELKRVRNLGVKFS